MVNYIHDANPFNLAGPPDWWLRKLWEFDPSLVVIPSKQDFVYRLCQKRPPDPRAKLVGELQNDSDSKMIAAHNCIPVTTINATARWDNPLMWEDLRRRCPWRMGGWEAYEKEMDALEEKEQLEKAAVADDRNTILAKDGYKYYQKKQGLRTHIYSPTVKQKQDTSRMKSPQIVIK